VDYVKTSRLGLASVHSLHVSIHDGRRGQQSYSFIKVADWLERLVQDASSGPWLWFVATRGAWQIIPNYSGTNAAWECRKILPYRPLLNFTPSIWLDTVPTYLEGIKPVGKQ